LIHFYKRLNRFIKRARLKKLSFTSEVRFFKIT